MTKISKCCSAKVVTFKGDMGWNVICSKCDKETEIVEINKKTIIKRILSFFSRENDPVYSCKLYKDKGCSHVDGMLCDFPKCSMNDEYLKTCISCKSKDSRKKGDNYYVCNVCGQTWSTKT